MKLHENTEEFMRILNAISNSTGIRNDILEKDYYVMMILDEIAKKQNEIKMFFKGGTALYKIMEEPRRFSEDIDLTVDVRGLSNTQAKKHLINASQKFEALPRLKGDSMEENTKGSITCVYGYDSLFEIPKHDELNRFGKLKIEATSFTISAPTSSYNIEPLLFKYASDEERNVLIELECRPFSIQTVSLERMFADKILAAEFYVQREIYRDVAKHVYDICVLLSDKRIQTVLANDDLLIEALSFKRIEEKRRIGSDLSNKPLNELSLFDKFNTETFWKAFQQMQRIYVFNDEYKLSEKFVTDQLFLLNQTLNRISSKEQGYLQSKEFKKLSKQFNEEKTGIEFSDD